MRKAATSTNWRLTVRYSISCAEGPRYVECRFLLKLLILRADLDLFLIPFLSQ
jgi:hypothetical protein